MSTAATYRPNPVLPRLRNSPFLDYLLKVKRGPDGVEMDPQDAFATEGENMCSCLTTALGVEAAYQALGHENAELTGFSTSLVNAAKVSGGRLVAIGTVLKTGRQICFCEATVYQGLKIISKVTVNFVLLGRG
jgi:hypothetical protein